MDASGAAYPSIPIDSWYTILNLQAGTLILIFSVGDLQDVDKLTSLLTGNQDPGNFSTVEDVAASVDFFAFLLKRGQAVSWFVGPTLPLHGTANLGQQGKQPQSTTVGERLILMFKSTKRTGGGLWGETKHRELWLHGMS